MGYDDNRNKRRSQIFGDIEDPIDWAEDQAREIVVTLFDTAEISFTLRRFAEELLGVKPFNSESARSRFAFNLSISIAPHLRKFKSMLIGNSGKALAESRMEAIRKQIMSPASTARQIRKYAESLDGRGWSDEANVLRDAATILEEDL